MISRVREVLCLAVATSVEAIHDSLVSSCSVGIGGQARFPTDRCTPRCPIVPNLAAIRVLSPVGHSASSSLAANITRLCTGYAKALVVDMVWTIQVRRF